MNFRAAPADERTTLATKPFSIADQILAEIEHYRFDLDSVSDYDPLVRAEIAEGVKELRSIRNVRAEILLKAPEKRLRHQAIDELDPVRRDQAVWQLIASHPETALETLGESVRSAPTTRLAVSALIAAQRVACHDPATADKLLTEIIDTADDIEVVEWARLFLNEMHAELGDGYERLVRPASDRDFVHDPANVFDVTMPLVFNCHAFTRVGPATWHSVISPEWFGRVFGHAMACVRQDTYMTNLVLEKLVPELHADGSPHYEHFPFSGSTDVVAPGVYMHNYWAQLYRPFYTSGRTEEVTEKHDVIRGVPMTFCRVAATVAPERYRVNDAPIPESVRGIFFGYGHISPTTLLKRRLDIRSGDFQLSSRLHPESGKPANTYFYGTFFGKLGDQDGDGKLDVNTVPVHCDKDGRLDYHGDGTMAKDPVRPEDWH